MIVEDYFLIEPDWQYFINMGRTWRTALQTSIDKSEKRAKLRSWPTKRLNFTVVPFTAEENNYIRRKFYRAAGKIFGVPIWTDRCVTTQIVDSGSSTTFTVDDNTLRQFEVGAPIMLFGDINNYEVKNIVTIGSNQFTIDSDYTGTWPIGTYVYPVLQGRLLKSQDLAEHTTWGHYPIVIECSEEFDEDITRSVFSGSSFSSYLNLPVLNIEPNRVISPKSVFEVFPNVTSFMSRSLDYSFSNEAQIRSEYLWSFSSRAAMFELVKFFDECSGRWSNFWYPSWMDDIVLTATFSDADTTLSIEDIEWVDYWSTTKANGRYLYVLLPDGTEIIRKILSAPSDTSILVDAAMGTTITSLSGVIACFLYMGRFNSDELTLKYFTEGYAETQLELATLQDVTGTTTT
jgi:hypothetical protein